MMMSKFLDDLETILSEGELQGKSAELIVSDISARVADEREGVDEV